MPAYAFHIRPECASAESSSPSSAVAECIARQSEPFASHLESAPLATSQLRHCALIQHRLVGELFRNKIHEHLSSL